ncbi:hypothetical protein AAG906_009224 [Vitis piasezkii]
MVEEMKLLIKNKTWTLVDRPRNKKIVSFGLVARGFIPRKGVYYNEIFSPVVKHSSIKMILALVADRIMELEQLDVKTAFLHGELEKTVYMQQPEGFDFGMEITRDRHKGELYLSQRSYINKVIDRFGMKDAKPISRPMKFMVKVPYASVVSSVMYSMKILIGYIFTLLGTAISWKANLLATVSFSTTETECIAVVEAIKKAIWLKCIIEELGLKQNTIHLTKNQMFHEMTKHINVKMHFVREIVAGGAVVVVKISTEDNLFRQCLNLINIQGCSSPLKVTYLIRRN